MKKRSHHLDDRDLKEGGAIDKMDKRAEDLRRRFRRALGV